MTMKKWVLFALGLLALTGVQAAWAETPEEFYRGKQVRFIVGTAAGQEYDLWSRLIARHLRRHIPGTPTIVVENMPGAGHVIAANYLFDVAPRDGTVIGMVSRNIPDAAVLKLPGVRFDPRKFNWLGSPEQAHRVLIVSANSGISKAEDLFERELIIGAVGAAQAVTTAPILLKNILGMKLKVVTGYHAPQDVLLAMERGEVGGVVETIATMKGKRAQHVLSGKVRLLFNMEQERVAEFGVPSIFEFIKKEDDRQIFQFLSSSMEMGRPMLAPPDVPADRVAALRKAFLDTMKDPAFVQEAETQGFEITVKTGEELAKLVNAEMQIPQSIIERASKGAVAN
jgi:tripartite-type tricarboxylate transporter receptor subunit TctC